MIATTTDRPDHDVRPRGKAQRERWYRDHARAAETLFVVILLAYLPQGAPSPPSLTLQAWRQGSQE